MSLKIEYMMNRILIIISFLINVLSYSQNNSEAEVFKKVIDYEIERGSKGIYIQCEKYKTSYDLKEFKEETRLNIPENILNEIEINKSKSSNGIWNSELINGLNYDSNFIKSKKCLTYNEVQRLFKETNTYQHILSISEPIFDNGYENCVVSVSFSTFTHSSYGNSYFLKKVYGVWVIINSYAFWMT